MADETMTLDPATGFSHEDLRRAALVVCGHAADAQDARELLDALGLSEDLRPQRLAG